MEDRVHTLQAISGLEVKHRYEGVDSVYSFWLDGKTIKETFTYPKAKLFAEGVAVGIKLKTTLLSRAEP